MSAMLSGCSTGSPVDVSKIEEIEPTDAVVAKNETKTDVGIMPASTNVKEVPMEIVKVDTKNNAKTEVISEEKESEKQAVVTTADVKKQASQIQKPLKKHQIIHQNNKEYRG